MFKKLFCVFTSSCSAWPTIGKLIEWVTKYKLKYKQKNKIVFIFDEENFNQSFDLGSLFKFLLFFSLFFHIIFFLFKVFLCFRLKSSNNESYSTRKQ